MIQIPGIDRFREYFAAYTDQYVLIGGTAAQLAMADAGLEFRATKDLDIVLIVEALTPDFAKAFWKFIHEGQYEHKEKSTGGKQFYRFQKPGVDGFVLRNWRLQIRNSIACWY